MPKKHLKILLIFDVDSKPKKDTNYACFLKREEWFGEREVIRGLKRLGHDIKILGLYDDLAILLAEIKNNFPDLVFNFCKRFKNNSDYGPHIITLLELLRVKFTGSGSLGTSICKDKALSKKILTYHNIPVPQFIVSQKKSPLKRLSPFKYPAIVKPLNMGGSAGISQSSYVRNERACLKRIEFIHSRFGVDAIVEEFIDGREIHMSILGNQRILVLPPREVSFNHFPKNMPKIDSENTKWYKIYRSKGSTYYCPARNIPQKILQKLNETSKKIGRLLHIKGHARIDFRINHSGEIYFLEANSNPGFAKDDNFIHAAKDYGLDYLALLEKIIGVTLSQPQ